MQTHAPSGLSAAGKVVDIYTADTSVPPSYDDWNGHGTHVAATIGGQTYGVADGVTLLNGESGEARGRQGTGALVPQGARRSNDGGSRRRPWP